MVFFSLQWSAAKLILWIWSVCVNNIIVFILADFIIMPIANAHAIVFGTHCEWSVKTHKCNPSLLEIWLKMWRNTVTFSYQQDKVVRVIMTMYDANVTQMNKREVIV